MRNLFVFLWKNHAFLLFLMLETFSAFLIVSNNSFQRSAFITSANSFSAGMLATVNDVSEYFSLRAQNDQLAAENARLRSKLSSAFLVSDNRIFVNNDTLYRQQFSFTEMKIINNSLNNRSNYLLLNKGKMQGIKRDMGLINSKGVIGIVKDVSPNFSAAMSVLHAKVTIDAKIKKTGYTGTVIWEGGSYRHGSLINIPSHVPLTKGDTIVTSGNSSIFPEGIMIGTVETVKLKPGESFYRIRILYSVDYNKVEHAYAVLNLFKDEQDILIKKTEDD